MMNGTKWPGNENNTIGRSLPPPPIPVKSSLNHTDQLPPSLPPRSTLPGPIALQRQLSNQRSDLNMILPPPRIDSNDLPHSNSAPDLKNTFGSDYIRAWQCPTGPTQDVLAGFRKRDDNNLIDLIPAFRKEDTPEADCADVLELFDPLRGSSSRENTPAQADTFSEDAPSTSGSSSSPEQRVSETQSVPDVPKAPDTPTPKQRTILPPAAVKYDEEPSSVEQVLSRGQQIRLSRLENLKLLQRIDQADPETEEFWCKARRLRSEFTYEDQLTNPGLVVSPTLEHKWEEPTSVKVEIQTPFATKPFSFTCDVSTSVLHMISHAVCSTLENHVVSMDAFALKVRGRAEYLTPDSTIKEYEYAHQCVKFDRAIRLTLIEVIDLKRPWARTREDDAEFLNMKATELIYRKNSSKTVNFQSMIILVEAFRREAEILLCSDNLQPNGVIQTIKGICLLLSQIETPEVQNAVEGVRQLCQDNQSCVIGRERVAEAISFQLSSVQRSLQNLFDLYSRSFPVDFEVPAPLNTVPKPRKEIINYHDNMLFNVGEVYQLHPQWLLDYSLFVISCELRHGINSLFKEETKTVSAQTSSFFPHLCFDEWLQLAMPMRLLPRESVIYISLYGIDRENDTQRSLLGWFGVRLFNSKRELLQGQVLCGFWPPDVEQRSGPACYNEDVGVPLMRLQFTDFDATIFFPKVCHGRQDPIKPEFVPLERDELRKVFACDPLSPPQDQREAEFFWEHREYVAVLPDMLPKVLLSCTTWSWRYLADIYYLLRAWVPSNPVDALTLLLGTFADAEVRREAVNWLRNIGSDELCDHLPQFVQALRFETWDDSPVTWFLLERALTSVRVAFQLYWLLEQYIENPLSRRRMLLMREVLLIFCGNNFRTRLRLQQRLLRELDAVAMNLKETKESLRVERLLASMEHVHNDFEGMPVCIPLSPSLEMVGIDVKNCSYFTSNTLPLKVVFKNAEHGSDNYDAIYKVGDDIRQDMLTLQMIKIMDKLWLKEGIDLKIITFDCVATGPRKGIIEMVPQAETLRKIQVEHGLTGSFKDKPIAEWLQKHNTSEREYRQAVDNFTKSLAGYCVATYVLGICDRHNDNIMLTPSGHLFHIDFGKFLGDSQTFATIKRDRTPFVLTSDMVYVVNGGDKPSRQFQEFVDWCCRAFNILRRNGTILMSLFGLMVSSGIPGLTQEAVQFVQKSLLLGARDEEASVHFTRLIEESLKNRFTQLNFFIHNIAQMRFTADHNDEYLLSFVPKTFTCEQDGRITEMQVVDCVKRSLPEKHYAYVIRLRRLNEAVDTFVHRTYPEFLEFYAKLTRMFPLAKFASLPRGSIVGRNNTRDIAERRMADIKDFLATLSTMAVEVAHCDLVYTFFHPLLRDQEGGSVPSTIEASGPALQEIDPASGLQSKGIRGRVKLDLTYAHNRLSVMVIHAESLICDRKPHPDAYVKTYLHPDPDKTTKRKTKVVLKNQHPTFMQLVTYNMPYEALQTRVLEVSVWDHDSLQGNEVIGTALIRLSQVDFSKPHIDWFSLNFRKI